MIKASLSGTTIIITSDAADATQASRIYGVTRNAKMPPMTWHLPFNLDNIQQLRDVRALASTDLIAAAREAAETAQIIETIKDIEEPAPVQEIPVKKDVHLYNHQIKAFNIALMLFDHHRQDNTRKGGSVALYMEMGTGKTLSAIVIVGRLFLAGCVRRLLIVAPSSVCAVWPAEFRKFAEYPSRVGVLLGERDKRIAALNRINAPVPPGMPEPLRMAVINYESTWRLEEELAAFKADMIICDESQRIKNPTARQSKAMHRLGAKTLYKMILTGTPIQNDTRDFWSQYRFVAPDIFQPSYYAYLKRYAVMGGVGNHQFLGPRNLEELTRKAHSIAYRVTKEECLDLPEKMFEDRVVMLEERARKLYKRIQRESCATLESGQEITANIILTKLLRLQQITGGFLTDDEGKITAVSTAKLDALDDIVQTLCVDEMKKVVVFARFHAELDAIQERVKKVLGTDLKHVAIWGDVPISKRSAIVEQFQTDPDTRVFVGQIDACAEGITLTASDTVVYFSLTYNLAKYQQSQDRIHRIGQKNHCTYIHLVAPGTIDHQIMGALKRKEDLAKTVVDNWRALFDVEEDA